MRGARRSTDGAMSEEEAQAILTDRKFSSAYVSDDGILSWGNGQPIKALEERQAIWVLRQDLREKFAYEAENVEAAGGAAQPEPGGKNPDMTEAATDSRTKAQLLQAIKELETYKENINRQLEEANKAATTARDSKREAQAAQAAAEKERDIAKKAESAAEKREAAANKAMIDAQKDRDLARSFLSDDGRATLDELETVRGERDLLVGRAETAEARVTELEANARNPGYGPLTIAATGIITGITAFVCSLLAFVVMWLLLDDGEYASRTQVVFWLGFATFVAIIVAIGASVIGAKLWRKIQD